MHRRAAVLLLAASCAQQPAPSGRGTRASGSAALSSDDAFLYIADADNNALHVVATANLARVASVPVGKWPEAVAVGAHDEIYVSNRYDRTVSVVARGSWAAPVATISVGAEPTGLAVSPDQKTLLVANNSSGTVSVIDVDTRKVKGEIPVAHDVRAVAFSLDGQAWATVAKTGEVIKLDLGQRVMALRIGLAQSVTRNSGSDFLETPPSDFGGDFNSGVDMPGNSSARTPGQAVLLVVSADGTKLFAPHAVSKQSTIPTQETRSSYADSSSPNLPPAPVVAPAVATIDLSAGTLVHPDATASPGHDIPPAMLLSSGHAMNGPVAGVVDPTGEWLFLVNQTSNNVAVVSTTRKAVDSDSLDQGLFGIIDVGAGPRGIAISRDGRFAYVHNQFDETVSVLSGVGSDSISVRNTLKLAENPLPAPVARGRALFYAANDARMSDTNVGGIACASCHPQGRDDGRTWQFPEGPRNTPSLVGRHIEKTAPYHWDGKLETMHSFQTIVQDRMGGSGIEDSDFDEMLAYLAWQPGADNPNVGAHGEISATAQRGAAAFLKANCNSCHTGETLTDNAFHDVGTLKIEAQRVSTNLIVSELNTPSLAGLFATAPYLHNGKAATLSARLSDQAGLTGIHGSTTHLSAAEKDELEAYLKTL